MTSISPPPLQEKLSDSKGFLIPAWALFFNQVYIGDTGQVWSPTFTSLGSTGTPTISGSYYKLNKSLVYFKITITPGTNTSSVGGTTYTDNFPLQFSGDGACLAVAPFSGLGVGLGVVRASDNRILTPTWTNASEPVIIIGVGEAR